MMENWQGAGNPFSRTANLFKDFTEEITQEWINAGFDKTETRIWLESGLQSIDVNFARWLRDDKKIDVMDAEKALSYEEEKSRKEYKEFFKSFPIPGQWYFQRHLGGRYFGIKMFEGTGSIEKPSFYEKCNTKRFVQGFNNWTSGNPKNEKI